MKNIVDIKKVAFDPYNMIATVNLSPDAPLMTSMNVEATSMVYWLMPKIADHACACDSGKTFKECMGDTELAHLLEHITIELMAETNLAGDITVGRTAPTRESRTYDITISCADDILGASAISSAIWIMNWAFGGGTEEDCPDVASIVEGIKSLVAPEKTLIDETVLSGDSVDSEETSKLQKIDSKEKIDADLSGEIPASKTKSIASKLPSFKTGTFNIPKEKIESALKSPEDKPKEELDANAFLDEPLKPLEIKPKSSTKKTAVHTSKKQSSSVHLSDTVGFMVDNKK